MIYTDLGKDSSKEKGRKTDLGYLLSNRKWHTELSQDWTDILEG